MSDFYNIKHKNKSFVLIRTDTGRWFDIKGCHVLTDGQIPDLDGLILGAKRVSREFVAEKVAKSARAKVKRSNIRRFQKKEAAI